MTTRFVCILLILASFASPNPAQAQVREIAAGASLESVLSMIRNALTEVISEAEGSATTAGFSLATDANILLQNIEALIASSSARVFGDLTRAQQTAIRDALKLADEVNRGAADRMDDLDRVVRTLGTEMSRVPGVEDRPFVSRHSPSYIRLGEPSHTIAFSGSRLGVDEATLQFGATPCEWIGSTDMDLRFRCPQEIFDIGRNDWVSGRLMLTDESSWYELWKSDEQFEYRVAVMAIQELLGRYSLKVSETRTSEDRVNRAGKNSYRNDHCRGGKQKVWTFRPAPGCKVDVTSIKVGHRESKNSSYEGIVNASAHGFQVRTHVRNHGSCGPFGVPKDGRGSVGISATWTDVCPKSIQADLEPEQGELFWDSDRSFEFPETVRSFILTVEQLNGERRTITGTDSTPWFTADYDPLKRVLVVRPRTLESAFH